MFLYIALFLFAVYFIFYIFSPTPAKVFGVYSQPGKWYKLKYYVFLVLFSLRQRENRKKTVAKGTDAGYGLRSRSTPEEMEQVQKLNSSQPMAVDAVYFNGGNKDGQFVVAATARRFNDLVQTLLYLRIPGVGLLEMPHLPDSALYSSEQDSFSAGGLQLKSVEPMKKWKISFDGKMRLTKEDTTVTEVLVKFDLKWDAYTKCFDFDTDLNAFAMCDAMARETWTREFFNNLRSAHQTHYEQFGEISGKVNIEGYGDQDVLVQGVRDHSYGNKRDWKDLHRYMLQYMHLADGRAICVGIICFPITMSRILVGYVFHPNGKDFDTVSSTDLEFFRFGDDGKPPKNVKFQFVAGEKKYDVECCVMESSQFYMGLEWDAVIHERMCQYKVNGVPGWGISEWEYRHDDGCPDKVKEKRKH